MSYRPLADGFRALHRPEHLHRSATSPWSHLNKPPLCEIQIPQYYKRSLNAARARHGTKPHISDVPDPPQDAEPVDPMQMPEQRAVLADRLLPAPALDKRRQIEQMLSVPSTKPAAAASGPCRSGPGFDASSFNQSRVMRRRIRWAPRMNQRRRIGDRLPRRTYTVHSRGRSSTSSVRSSIRRTVDVSPCATASARFVGQNGGGRGTYRRRSC